LAGQDLLHARAGQLERQVLVGDGARDGRDDHTRALPGTLACWRHNVRKFSISFMPDVVRMDSGWNCTPQVSCPLCFNPISSFSGVHAMTSSTSGSVSRSTINE